MSHPVNIAVVTATLAARVQGLIDGSPLAGAVSVSTVPPPSEPDPGVYIALYQAMPNAALRNLDLPTRRADGTLQDRPLLALDLHYLFTFVGDGELYEPERLLGLVALSLEAEPLITREEIDRTLAPLAADHFLRASDLARQVDLVRVTPLGLDLENLARVWSMMSQGDYALSVAYRAAAVLLEPSEAPEAALPVAARGLHARPLQSPRIDGLVSAAGDAAPIVVGDTLIVRGAQLAAETVRVLVDDVELRPDAADARPTELRVALDPAAGLTAGLKIVRVVHPVTFQDALDASDQQRPGPSSNEMVMALRPVLDTVTFTALGGDRQRFDVTTTPPPAEGQRFVLVLNQPAGGARFLFESEQVVVAAPDPVIRFDVDAIPTGTYLARIRIDGAESTLTVGAAGYSGPSVVVP